MSLRGLYARVMCSANATIRHLASFSLSLAPGYDPSGVSVSIRRGEVAANLSFGYNCDAISMMQLTSDRLTTLLSNFLLQS